MTRKPRKRRQQAAKKAEKGRSEESPLPMVGKGITQVKGAALFDRPFVQRGACIQGRASESAPKRAQRSK